MDCNWARMPLSVAARFCSNVLTRSAWNCSSDTFVVLGAPLPGRAAAGAGPVRGCDAGLLTNVPGTVAVVILRVVLRTSMTCLGVQFAFERHFVAPAFQASWTMFVRYVFENTMTGSWSWPFNARTFFM